MAKQTFTDFNAWVAAVEAAGLVVRNDPPAHEGMHEDDLYGVCWPVPPEVMLIDHGDGWSDFARGYYSNDPDGGEGVLFDNAQEYDTWFYEAQCKAYGDDPTLVTADLLPPTKEQS
jgi:hypothetical protein